MQSDPREDVYIFKPSETGFESLITTGITLRPGQTERHSGFDYYMKGLPVPEECVAASFNVAAVNRRMPDFLYYRDCEIFISNRARMAFEELVPGAIDYIDIKLNITPCMEPADAYYYINVLPRAQILDWAAMILPPETRADGSFYWSALNYNETAKFKNRTPDHPLLWHEINLNKSHLTSQHYVLMRGDLWEELDARFPEQLLKLKCNY